MIIIAALYICSALLNYMLFHEQAPGGNRGVIAFISIVWPLTWAYALVGTLILWVVGKVKKWRRS